MDLKLNNNSNLTLPVYNVVEYVESYGTPNIDTGVNITISTTGYYTVEAVIEVLEGTGSSSYIWYANGFGDSASIYLKCDGSNTQFKARQYNKTDLNVEFTGKTKIKQGWGYIEINGVRTSTSTTGNSRKGNLYLLYSGELKVRIWSFKVYNYSNTLVRDYIPAVSLQAGHIGEPCLYDKVGNKCYYAGANGNFTASNIGFYDTINTIYIKDCPSISGIGVLRKSYNLERVRCDIGEATGHLSEIYKYSNLTGFNDSYGEQTKPRLVGTFNIDNYYSNSEVYGISERLDGTTINTPDSTQYDVEYLLENDQLAVQTFDDVEQNYNPATAIILSNNSYGSVLDEPLYGSSGKYSIKKSVASNMTSISTLFRGKTTVLDSSGVVSDDTSAEYSFESFDEFKYWTGLTTITAGSSTSALGSFGGCTALESIEIPEGVTTIGAYAFYNCTALNRIVLPSTLTTTEDHCFTGCTGLIDNYVYYSGTLSQWMDINFNTTDAGRATSPTHQSAHLFIQGEELTSLVIPSEKTSIKNKTFFGLKYLIGSLVIPNTITSIGISSFRNCSGLTELVIPGTVTSIGQGAFTSCTNISTVTLHDGLKTVGASAFYNCNNLENLILPDSVTSVGGAVVGIATKLNDLYIPCSIVLGVLSSNNSNPGSSANCIGSGLGTLYIKGNLTASGGYGSTGAPIRFKTVIVCGQHATTAANTSLLTQSQITDYHGYDVRLNKTSTLSTSLIAGTRPKFIDIYKLYSVGANASLMDNYSSGFSSTILHLEYNEVTSATPTNVRIARITKVYLGAGLSATDDTNLLNLYLADTNWSGQSAKLAIWYDYNGEYRTYKVVDNLTNCTNTNPDEWPHITRGKSYQTTIVPNEGMTLGSVTVEMYEAVDDGVTPNTPTDITSSVYDSSTGEINIPSVTGNVIITAMAS